MSFEILKKPVLWEGVIIPGIEFSDPRFETYIAKPRASLKKYIEIAWLFKWNIPDGQELPLIVVPTPCFKLFKQQEERDFRYFGPRTVGVFRKQFGSGVSMGLDFVPGGFFPFSRTQADVVTNTAADVQDLLRGFPQPTEKSWSPESANEWFEKVQDYLESLVPCENNLLPIGKFFDHLWKETDAPDLDTLKEDFMMSKRSLQRLFSKEIGVSPREAIRITRLQKAMKTISRLDVKTLAEAAIESGFFDQPHMIKEFNALIKSPPIAFKKYI